MQLWQLAVLVGAALGDPAGDGWDKAAAQKQVVDLSSQVEQLGGALAAAAAAAGSAQRKERAASVAAAEAHELAGRLALARGGAEQSLTRARRLAALNRKADGSVAALLHRAKVAQVALGGAVQSLAQTGAAATLEAAALRHTQASAARTAQGWEASARAVQTGLEGAYRTTARLQEVLDTVKRDSAASEAKLAQQNELLKSRLQATLARERAEASALASETRRADAAAASLEKATVAEHAEAAALAVAGSAKRDAVNAERARQQTDTHALEAAKHRAAKLERDNEEAAAEIRHLQEDLRAEQSRHKVAPAPWDGARKGTRR